MEYKKNDLVMVTIEDMGSEGEGIGRAEGFTLFVKDAVVGDTVLARIVKPKKTYAYARLEKLLKASPFRAEPRCRCHRQCGGCQLQALSYKKQLEFKQNKIRGSLIRIGCFKEALIDWCMEPVVGMEDPWHYRNKAQYPVSTDREGNLITGFYAGRTHTVISNTDCALGAEENRIILETILEYMRENQVSAYDEVTGRGLVRHILIRKGFTSAEIMVCLVINGVVNGNASRQQDRVLCESQNEKVSGGKSLENSAVRCVKRVEGNPLSQETEGKQTEIEKDKKRGRGREKGRGNHGEKDLGEFLPAQGKLIQSLRQIPGMKSISVSVNSEKTNVIMGREIHTLWGSDTISDTIHVRDMTRPGYPLTGRELTFHISPLSFYQVNPVQTEKLYSLALEYAGLTGQETVWDLYCGIGTISLFLAGNAKRVFGVEIIPEAVQDARDNAVRNGISNAEFFTGKAEEVLPAFYAERAGEEELQATADMRHPDVILVDPPRKGCDAACLDTMLKMRPERIVYVSCDSATLARDLKVLCQGGYELKRIRGVDQFGMTVHVEVVCLLSKLNVGQHIEA